MHQAISDKEYQAQIAELAKVLYAAFRQLETQDQNPVQSDCQADSTKDPFPKTNKLAKGGTTSAA
jgi:hypothetical protein